MLENRNYTARVRDRKRKTYCEFLKWCEATPGLTHFEFPEDRAEWLPRMMEHFPQFKIDYAKSLADLARQQEVKAKFNGEWVSQLTGLKGKELGFLMKKFKESFDSVEAQQEFELNSTLEELEAKLRQLLSALAP